MIMISRIIIIMIIVFILFAILARRMRLHTLTLSGNGVYKSWWRRENREEEREKISGDVSFDASELNNGKTLDHLGTPIVLQNTCCFVPTLIIRSTQKDDYNTINVSQRCQRFLVVSFFPTCSLNYLVLPLYSQCMHIFYFVSRSPSLTYHCHLLSNTFVSYVLRTD